MNCLFDFINNYSLGNFKTDEFIKSQILHFYFVYIHPYYDINGITARCGSIWHLLNDKAYPYVIFNRGIHLNKNEYYKVIREVKKFGNITYFINYMLNTVLIELEKEHAMQSIADYCNYKLTGTDYQTLHYLLSMNGLARVNDFANIYNKHNTKKKAMHIREEMILPLEDKNIIIPGRTTNGHISRDTNNYVITLNKKYVDDGYKVKDINILKKGNI